MRIRALSLLLTCIALVALVAPGPAGADDVVDLSVAVASPPATMANTDLAFTITVSNRDPDPAGQVSLDDAIPDNTTFVSLAAPSGASCTTPAVGGTGSASCSLPTLAASSTAVFTLTVHVDPGTPAGTYITDVPTISNDGTKLDPNSENDQASASAQVGPVTRADMAVTTTGPDAVLPDSDISYTITVQNNGPDAAGVTLQDDLLDNVTFVSLTQASGPPASCSTPAVGNTGSVFCSASLPSGASSRFTLVGHVPADAGEVTNRSQVTTGAYDATEENDVSTTYAMVGSADMAVTATGPATAARNDSLTFAITLANNGPDTAYPATLTIPAPANTTFASFTQTSGPQFRRTTPVAGGTGTVTATTNVLGSGSTATFTLVLTVKANAPNNATIKTNFTASSSVADPNPNNNASSVNTVVTVPSGGRGESADATETSAAPAAGSTPPADGAGSKRRAKPATPRARCARADRKGRAARPARLVRRGCRSKRARAHREALR